MSTHFGPAVPPERMTLEHWGELDDERRELVDGVLVEGAVPSYLHEVVIRYLVVAVGSWASNRGVLVAGSGAKFAVSRTRGRMPDLTVYLAEAKRPQLRGLIDVRPSIAVEVVSSSPRDQRRDRIEKLIEYAAFGVPWYWLVDPELRTFEILELADGRYAHALSAIEGTVTNVPGCDGLVIDVSALWAEVDALIDNAR
jgi:Uma2 family endonuclease